MQSNHSFGVHFYLRKNRGEKQTGLSPLYVRVTVNKQRAVLALKFRLEPKDWISVRGMAKPKSDYLKGLNTELEQMRSRLVVCFHELIKEGANITAEKVIARYIGDPENCPTLMDLVEHHHKTDGAKLKRGTMKNYDTTKAYLKDFLAHRFDKEDILLKEMNHQTFMEIEAFLMLYPRRKGKKLTNNGLMKHMERLRRLTRLAVDLNWLPSDPLGDYKLKFLPFERGVLLEHELSAMRVFQFSIEGRLAFVRDLFVFSCYTGLSFSDVMGLERGNLKTFFDGNIWIITTRQKTDTPVKVPLLEEAKEIIERYQNAHGTDGQYLFPRISNQEVNRQLKVIAGILGISTKLTFHVSRHTFATTVALLNGVSIETVSKMLGHTKISTTQIYAKILDTKISLEMNLLQHTLKQKETRQPTNVYVGPQTPLAVCENFSVVRFK